MKQRNKYAIPDSPAPPLLPLRLYSILHAQNASAPPSSTPTSTDVIASKSNVVALAVGLSFGLLTLIVVVLGGLCLKRRKRRRSVDLLDAHDTPLSRIPPTQVDQRLGVPQASKRTSRHTLSPILGSTPLPVGYMTTAVSTTSIGITELELPPSYESHMKTGRVATHE
jgi:hypothetical protein